MQTPGTEAILRECDFCGFRGIPGETLLDKEGWHLCGPCLAEVEYEMKKRKAERILL
jgi:hypothetical protein